MVTIANEQTAKEVSAALTEAYTNIERSFQIVSSTCTQDEWNAYKDKASELIYIITFKLLEPLYWQHPALRPEGWDDKPPMDPD